MLIMQAIVETLFDTVYLISVITIGILMIRKSKGNRQFTMFGIMAVLLGSGDAFHLVPRAVALCTTGLENFTVQLGLGKWITSITMTIFYVVLYHIWRERYQIKGCKATTAAIYGLAGLRIVLCMMPQNAWLSAAAPLSWGIYRNIPFALMRLIIIALFYKSAKENNDSAFRWMWLTIVLSFAFYIPVVLWADVIPMIGMLMIPKNLCIRVDRINRLQGNEKRNSVRCKLSKKVCSPLGPLCEGDSPRCGEMSRQRQRDPGPKGSARRLWGERTVRLPEIFRAMARFPPSAPSRHRSPLWRKRHLCRIGGVCFAEGDFFDTLSVRYNL